MDADWIRIGRVRSVNAARRELRIVPEDGCEPLFGNSEWIHVRLADERLLRCRTTSVRWHAGSALVLLSPGVTRETVARTKGAFVVAPAGDGDRFGKVRICDLIGLRVLRVDGSVLGTVKDVYPTRGSDVVEVAATGSKTLLFPLVEPLVETVDMNRGVLIVRDTTPYAVEYED